MALSGQYHTRIARQIETPLVAGAVALESREGTRVIDQAIMISCDLVAVRRGVQSRFRELLQSRLPDFDVRKAILSATHTHTAPVTMEENFTYEIPKEGVVQPEEYVDFLVRQLTEAAVKAWQARRPGGVSWTLGQAVVGYNRRAVYENGSSQMYGRTDTPAFRALEGYEDHAVEMLFFWDRAKRLQAIAINLACPAQTVESRSTVNADYWHEVRRRLGQQYGNDLVVLGWISAAGDQSPHLMWRKKAEERMRSAAQDSPRPRKSAAGSPWPWPIPTTSPATTFAPRCRLPIASKSFSFRRARSAIQSTKAQSPTTRRSPPKRA